MADSTIWWLLAGAAVALELMTGTFYLLMLALGLGGGALAAHAGLGLVGQLSAAAVVGSLGVITLYLSKRRKASDPSVRSLRSVNLDVGEIVQVDHWKPDGTASVKYRGAQWTVVQRGGGAALPGAFRVTELEGNRLVVEKA